MFDNCCWDLNRDSFEKTETIPYLQPVKFSPRPSYKYCIQPFPAYYRIPESCSNPCPPYEKPICRPDPCCQCEPICKPDPCCIEINPCPPYEKPKLCCKPKPCCIEINPCPPCEKPICKPDPCCTCESIYKPIYKPICKPDPYCPKLEAHSTNHKFVFVPRKSIFRD